MKVTLTRRETLAGLSCAGIALQTGLAQAAGSAAFADASPELRIYARMSQWQRVTVTLREKETAFVVPQLSGFAQCGMPLGDDNLNRTRSFHSDTPTESGYLVSTRTFHTWSVRPNGDDLLHVPLDQMQLHLEHQALHAQYPLFTFFGDDWPGLSACHRGQYIAVHYLNARLSTVSQGKWDLVSQVAAAQGNNRDGEDHCSVVASATPQDGALWLDEYRRGDPEFRAHWESLFTLIRNESENLGVDPKGYWTRCEEPLRALV